MTEQHHRIEKLQQLIKEENEALLVTNENNVYYFSGFQHSEGAMLFTEEKTYLLVDFRYIEAARRTALGCEVLQFSDLSEDLNELLRRHKIKCLYGEAEHLTVRRCEYFTSALEKNGVKFCASQTLDRAIVNLRMIKSKTEIEWMQKAQRITEEAYTQVLPCIKPGVSEKDIAIELEYQMKKRGAQQVSFDLIAITGKHTSLPHGVPGNAKVRSGDFFTMDIGAVYRGYHSDMTRTVAVGSVSAEQKKIYSIVQKAQEEALRQVRSGVAAGQVDKIARDIIEQAGYGSCFGHSTGHGVGLDIHEQPSVSPKSKTFLSAGMVVTVEPGIYLPEQFGVRIEDMVCVTAGGYQNFASLSKNLIIL